MLKEEGEKKREKKKGKDERPLCIRCHQVRIHFVTYHPKKGREEGIRLIQCSS